MKLWAVCIAVMLLAGGVAMGQAVVPLGGQFQINSYTTSAQYHAIVAKDAQGDFVVVWQSGGSYGTGTDTDGWSIQAQRYDDTGTPAGSQFQVNSYTTSSQSAPSVSALGPEGSFVVVWASVGSYGTDLSTFSVQGQRFLTDVIFTEGFESGDFGDWVAFPPP